MTQHRTPRGLNSADYSENNKARRALEENRLRRENEKLKWENRWLKETVKELEDTVAMMLKETEHENIS